MRLINPVFFVENLTSLMCDLFPHIGYMSDIMAILFEINSDLLDNET